MAAGESPCDANASETEEQEDQENVPPANIASLHQHQLRARMLQTATSILGKRSASAVRTPAVVAAAREHQRNTSTAADESGQAPLANACISESCNDSKRLRRSGGHPNLPRPAAKQLAVPSALQSNHTRHGATFRLNCDLNHMPHANINSRAVFLQGQPPRPQSRPRHFNNTPADAVISNQPPTGTTELDCQDAMPSFYRSSQRPGLQRRKWHLQQAAGKAPDRSPALIHSSGTPAAKTTTQVDIPAHYGRRTVQHASKIPNATAAALQMREAGDGTLTGLQGQNKAPGSAARSDREASDTTKRDKLSELLRGFDSLLSGKVQQAPSTTAGMERDPSTTQNENGPDCAPKREFYPQNCEISRRDLPTAGVGRVSVTQQDKRNGAGAGPCVPASQAAQKTADRSSPGLTPQSKKGGEHATMAAAAAATDRYENVSRGQPALGSKDLALSRHRTVNSSMHTCLHPRTSLTPHLSVRSSRELAIGSRSRSGAGIGPHSPTTDAAAEAATSNRPSPFERYGVPQNCMLPLSEEQELHLAPACRMSPVSSGGRLLPAGSPRLSLSCISDGAATFDEGLGIQIPEAEAAMNRSRSRRRMSCRGSGNPGAAAVSTDLTTWGLGIDSSQSPNAMHSMIDLPSPLWRAERVQFNQQHNSAALAEIGSPTAGRLASSLALSGSQDHDLRLDDWIGDGLNQAAEGSAPFQMGGNQLPAGAALMSGAAPGALVYSSDSDDDFGPLRSTLACISPSFSLEGDCSIMSP